MKAHLKTVITLPMVPKDLRAIADTMERLWGRATIGDDTTSKVWLGDGFEIRFQIDQERMEREYGQFGQERVLAQSLKNGETQV